MSFLVLERRIWRADGEIPVLKNALFLNPQPVISLVPSLAERMLYFATFFRIIIIDILAVSSSYYVWRQLSSSY